MVHESAETHLALDIQDNKSAKGGGALTSGELAVISDIKISFFLKKAIVSQCSINMRLRSEVSAFCLLV